MAGAVDKFGIKLIYPTRKDGREWFIRETIDDVKNDSRVAGDLADDLKDGNNTDGFTVKDDGQVRLQVAAESNLRESSNTSLNHATAKSRGYAFTTKDWDLRGCEVTARFKCTDFDTSDSRFIMKGPTGSHHSNTVDCSGSAYNTRFFLAPSGSDSGKTEIAKEQWHVHYITRDSTTKSTGLGSIFNKWVVAKYIIYLVKSSSGTANWVKIELWLNSNNDGVTFKKVNETVDAGGWGDDATRCKADRDDEIMTWDNARFIWRWDGPHILFKDLSVREIDPLRTVDAGEPEPTPTTGTLSRDFIFQNNIIAFPIDACNLGQDTTPISEFYNVSDNGSQSNLHKERYRVGIVANGSNSFLIGKVPKRVTVRLSKTGNPPSGNITCVMRKGSDDEVATTFTWTGAGGNLDAANLTSSKADYVFENLTSTYAWQNTDRLNIEYSGNTVDVTNEVNVFRNSDNPIDGRYTCAVKFDSGGVPPTAYSAPDTTIDYAWKISD